MADKDFDFEEFLTRPKKHGFRQNKQRTTRNTSDTPTTRTTSNTDSSSLHPFSVRLDETYIETIKAVAWWKRMTQRELIEQAVDKLLSDLDSGQLDNIRSSFKQQS